jgi:hypothetical protein
MARIGAFMLDASILWQCTVGITRLLFGVDRLGVLHNDKACVGTACIAKAGSAAACAVDNACIISDC